MIDAEHATGIAYRGVLRTIRLLSAFTALAVGLVGCRRPTPPNIVIYVVDTLRADALASYGNSRVQTPAFDRLAAGGTRFERAYANASWTRASMGSLLTGEYPTTHGAVGRLDVLRPDLPSLAGELRRHGYRTAAIIANPNIGRVFGFAAGFDDFIELYQSDRARRLIQSYELTATADHVVDAALDWLTKRPAGPFFLLVFTIDPHAPYTPPAPYDKRYDDDYTGNIDGSLKSMFGLGVFGKIPPEREIRHLRALYDGEVAFNDVHLGRLLDALDQQKLSDHTVFVATSDHGEEFYEHGGRDHGHSLYEELIRVPLIVRWPERIGPQVMRQPVELLDLFPTLLRFATVEPAATAGHDWSAALFRSQEREESDDIYAELDLDTHHARALIRGTRKVIDTVGDGVLDFDLATDPWEQHRLDASAAAALEEDLQRMQKSVARKRGATRPLEPSQLPEGARQALEALGYIGRTPGR